ncbi:MAG: hypothetical protein PW734_04120 [Verrucomicrobium sp.]|nr:hypothetical protein [Verrucomicrobium sp.]
MGWRDTLKTEWAQAYVSLMRNINEEGPYHSPRDLQYAVGSLKLAGLHAANSLGKGEEELAAALKEAESWDPIGDLDHFFRRDWRVFQELIGRNPNYGKPEEPQTEMERNLSGYVTAFAKIGADAARLTALEETLANPEKLAALKLQAATRSSSMPQPGPGQEPPVREK